MFLIIDSFNLTSKQTFVVTGKCYLVKGTKPLQKYRFYLDVKNYAITNKLEQKIKDLGGVCTCFYYNNKCYFLNILIVFYGCFGG